MEERFKITVKDRVTGAETSYLVHGVGFSYNSRICEGKTQLVKMVLENPRTKTRNTKDGK